MDLKDRIEQQDIEKLFRISDQERADVLYNLLFQGLVDSPPNNDATESSFHSFWDANIRKIMQGLLPGGVAIRASNCHTSTAAQRPDFGFLYFNVCTFRGEEKSPSNTEDPRVGLCNKMKWTYDPAPYILGKPYNVATPNPFLAVYCAQDTMRQELF
jgi:hypothetical protein